jgi:hypothetical protein
MIIFTIEGINGMVRIETGEPCYNLYLQLADVPQSEVLSFT